MGPVATYPGTELETFAEAVNYPRWIVDAFRPYLAGTVAEVGAGIGTLSKLIVAAGARRVLAFEPATNLFPKLVEELAGEARCVPINDCLRQEHAAGCDAVAYINVLEHIENDLAELRRAHEALRPGGHLLLFVPALAWLYSDFDRRIGHFRRYTKAGLRQLVREAGYELVSDRYFDASGIIPWYVSFVVMRKQPTPASVRLYDRLVVPMIRRFEGALAPPVGKNLLLVARKPTAARPS